MERERNVSDRRILVALAVVTLAAGLVSASSAAATPPGAGGRDLLVAGRGTIEGTVTSSVTTAPLGAIEVCATDREVSFEAEPPSGFECTVTDGTGDYALELPAGEYEVEFYAPPASGLDFQTQFYKDKSRSGEAEPVDVTAGKATTGIDAALLPGGDIAGVVTSAMTSAPLDAVLVCASDKAIESGGCATTNSGGEYAITGLASGSYEVLFFTNDKESETTYELQYYDDATSPGLATLVKVAAGARTSPIDDALRLTAPLVRSAPSVVGSAVVGQTLTVAHGSWTNHPTGFVDKWLRCATPTSERCLILATGESYTPQPGDVGSVIVVDETAIGTSGDSKPVWSPASAVVAPAPVAAPAPAPLPSQTALVSVARLRSLLDRLLVPTGKNAKIAQLLKHKGYAIAFVAPSAGKLTLAWYLVPAGAHVAGAKPVLAASGSVSMATGGKAKLTIKLTVKGRALLAHASRLKLTAKGVLTGTGHGALTATRTFTLKR